MKNRVVILFLVTCGVTLLIRLAMSRLSAEVHDSDTVIIQPAATNQDPQKTISHAVNPPLKTVAKVSGPAPKTRPESQVEFRIVDGLAVAYGDIVLGEPENKEITEGWSEVTAAPQLWDKAEVPYAIDASLPNPERVEQAIQYFNAQTSVHFVPLTDQKDGLIFQSGSENCLSLLGRAGGMQPIKLDGKCGRREILHEIMHALGFVHEQSRTDRDQYVKILWENIDEKYWSQFAVVPEALMASVRDFPFDYHSIMLYRKETFSKDHSSPTMSSKSQNTIDPEENSLSDGDKKRLANLYP